MKGELLDLRWEERRCPYCRCASLFSRGWIGCSSCGKVVAGYYDKQLPDERPDELARFFE